MSNTLFNQVKSILLLAVLGLLLLGLAACDRAGPPQSNLEPALQKAEECVEPVDDIRRNHMAYLKDHKNATVIEGIRTTQHSLSACIACHVAPVRDDGSVIRYTDKQNDHFCASCHTYVGVKMDCFQCHADRPEVMDNPNYQHQLTDHKLQMLSSSASVEDLMLLGSELGGTK